MQLHGERAVILDVGGGVARIRVEREQCPRQGSACDVEPATDGVELGTRQLEIAHVVPIHVEEHGLEPWHGWEEVDEVSPFGNASELERAVRAYRCLDELGQEHTGEDGVLLDVRFGRWNHT